MKTNKELRREAWGLVKAGWGWRLFLVASACVLAACAFFAVWGICCGRYGIETWTDFQQSQIQAALSGITYAVPSRAAAMRLVGAEIFIDFFKYFFSGVVSFALAFVGLKALKGERPGWFCNSLAGVKDPFGMVWLAFRIALQTFLWSLLFFIPGIVAYYRYSQAWFLKAEHSDWGAGKCIAESGRMMRGRKMWLFAFDCSYWVPITLVLLLLLASVSLGGASAISGDEFACPSTVSIAMAVAAMVAMIPVAIWFHFGRTVAYREISTAAVPEA